MFRRTIGDDIISRRRVPLLVFLISSLLMLMQFPPAVAFDLSKGAVASRNFHRRELNGMATSTRTPITIARMSGDDKTDGNKVIDGKRIAADIRSEIQQVVHTMKQQEPQQVPGLAVVLVGSRRDSQTYVNMKKKACEEVGIQSFGYDYDASVSQEELLNKIIELNEQDDIHGILVQLPLPSHIDEETILNAIDPEKDVDGLHPYNVAKLASQGTHNSKTGSGDDVDIWSKGNLDRIPFSVPCTPLGCIELLDRSDVDIKGKHAVVIGRSNLVGLPISFLLLHRDATVTIVHSKTTNIEQEVSKGDIVIAAVGRAHLVKDSWIKGGAVVIDVGINSVDIPPNERKEGSKKTYKLVGDVDYDSVSSKCSKITPVPGGVGPMTIAMLLRNTLNACRRKNSRSK